MQRLLTRRQVAVLGAVLVVGAALALAAALSGASWVLVVLLLLQVVTLAALAVTRSQIGQARLQTSRQLIEAVRPLATSVQNLGPQQEAALRVLLAREDETRDRDRRVDALEETFRQEVRQSFLQVATDSWAYLNLARLVEVGGEFPAAGGWAATPQTLLAMVGAVQAREGEVLVVECGSGTSTIWLAAAMRQRGSGRVVAVEHEAEFAEATREHLRRNHLEDWAEVRYAPLAPVTVGETTYDWYDVACFEDLHSIDVLFVDGPPWRTGESARYPAVPVLGERLAPGAMVVLDDVGRDQEKVIAKRWTTEEHGTRRLTKDRRLDRSQTFSVQV